MMNKPAPRTQVDGMQDEYSFLTGIDTTSERNHVRQELKDDADINILLGKFGVGAIGQKPLRYAEVDLGIDLQQALNAIDETKRAWHTMPYNLREKYPSWQSLLNAIESGELKLNLEDNTVAVPTEKPKDPEEKTT